MGNEILFLSSTVALLAMACFSLVLGCLFRTRFRRLNGIAGDPSVAVFNREFNVFDPYPDRLRLISSFVTALPLVLLALTGAVVLLVMEIVATGLLLSLVVIVVSLNLLVVEGAFDIYQSAKTFTRAFQKGAGLGEGDLKVFRIVEKALPRLSYYYFGLAIGFALLGLVLPYAAPSLSWAFVQFTGLIFTGGTAMGFAPFTVPLLWMLSIVAIIIFIRRIKSRFSKAIFAQLLEST
jgi:uncharacterized membrane protein